MLDHFGQAVVILAIPTIVRAVAPRVKAVRVITPVLLCYMLGMALGNQPWVRFDTEFSLNITSAAVALAIPLMLFSADFLGWLRLARPTVISFLLATVCAIAAGLVSHILFADNRESASVAGMLVGVYIGGTPNMAAVGTALGVPTELFMQLNVTDMVWSSLYLLFLLTIARRVCGLFLPPFPREKEDPAMAFAPAGSRPPWRSIGLGVALAAAIVAVASLVGRVAPKGFEAALSVLSITTLAVLASFHPRVRALKGASDTGMFFLLVFCVAIGTTTDFGKLFTSPSALFFQTGFVMVGAIFLHYLFAFFLKIDVDTVLITSAAAIWAPPIVPPVAMALKNREMVMSGIASGLVGYAIGNYAGVAVAWLLGG
ncbi:MAG: DUF819 family protein [Myxococcales bacterium]|nr:MAG: DUF819 family protein [Myxococcales bacterium]